MASGSGGVARMGIWATDAYGRATGSPLIALGTYDANSISWKELPGSLAMPPGRYAIGWVGQVAAASSSVRATNDGDPTAANAASTLSGNAANGWWLAGVSGTLPSITPSALTPSTASNIPRMGVRFA